MKQMNINFRMVTHKGVAMTRLKQRFDKRLLSDIKYCRAYGFDKSMFSKLMDGRVTGQKAKEGSVTRRMILRLKADGIWLGRLPWEK